MTTKTTVHLTLPRPRSWWDLTVPQCAIICSVSLLLIAVIVGRMQSSESPATAPAILSPTSGPVILIQREAAPPVAPPTARVEYVYIYVTVAPIVVEPQVVYVAAQEGLQEAPPEAVATPAPEYTANAAEAVTPQYTVLLDRQQWAEDAQRRANIQGHYANNGIVMPYADTPAQRAQNRVQSCTEHPEWHC